MNGEVGTGKPSGLENRGTVKGDGSSSLPLSAIIEPFTNEQLEQAIRDRNMKKFMAEGWSHPEFWQRAKNY